MILSYESTHLRKTSASLSLHTDIHVKNKERARERNSRRTSCPLMPFFSKTCCAIKSPDPNKTAADRQFVISGRLRRAELAEETFVFSRKAARRVGHTCMLGGKLPCVRANQFPAHTYLWKTRLSRLHSRRPPAPPDSITASSSIAHEARILSPRVNKPSSQAIYGLASWPAY